MGRLQFRHSRKSPERATLFFDGGCAPNPGPIEIAVVWGGQACFRDGPARGDNNEAEWRALLFAVELAIEHGLSNVRFVGDSATVIAQASGRQPCRGAHLQPYLDAFLGAITAIPRFSLRRVPRGKNLAGIALAQRKRF